MEENNGEIMVEVVEGEVPEILHSFQKDKSPGPDGWPIEFYLGIFELIEGDLLKVVEESKWEGFIHAPMNSTFISLIPKTNKSHRFDDYRLISLCNCLYKVISKIIAKKD